MWTGKTAGEAFICVRATGATADRPGLWNLGGNDRTYYPYTNGDLYDGAFTSTRYQFDPVDDITVWRIYNVSKAAGTGSWNARIDNVVRSGPTSVTFVAPSQMVIGEYTGQWWSGDIAEVVMYDRELTSGERSDVYDYLAARHIIVDADVDAVTIASVATVGAPTFTVIDEPATIQAVATVPVPEDIQSDSAAALVNAVTVPAVATVGSPALPKFPATIQAVATVGTPFFPVFVATIPVVATVGGAFPIVDLPFTSTVNFRGLSATVTFADDRSGRVAVIDYPGDNQLVLAGGLDVVATLLSPDTADLQAEVSTSSAFTTILDTGVITDIDPDDQGTITLAGLTAGNTYYVRARAGSDTENEWGDWSATVTVTTSTNVGEGYVYLYATDVDTSPPVPQIWWTIYDPVEATVTIVGAGFGETEATYDAVIEGTTAGGTEELVVESWTQVDDTLAGGARDIAYKISADPQHQIIVVTAPADVDDAGVGIQVILNDGEQQSPIFYDYLPGGENPETRPNTGWWVEIRDFFDPSTVYATLHKFNNLSFTKPLNDAGFGSVSFARRDPIVKILLPSIDEPEGKLLLTFPSYWSFYYNGAERFRMVYEGKDKDRASAAEPEQIIISGSGRAVELQWSPVLPNNWPDNTKARPRKFEDSVWAESFIELLNESKDRGEITDINPTFTRTHDSYGVPWYTLGDREIEPGTTLFELLQTAADVEQFDWLVTASGKLHAAPSLGDDLSYDVRFFPGTTVNEIGAVETRTDIRNRIYVEGTAGRISSVDHALSQERWGVRAMYLRSDESSSQRQRERVAHGTIRQTRRPLREKSVKVPFEHLDPITQESYGRSLFIDYGLGDIVGFGPKIDADSGDPVSSRDVKVQEIGVTVNSTGQTEVDLTFESKVERIMERARRLLQARMGAGHPRKRLGKGNCRWRTCGTRTRSSRAPGTPSSMTTRRRGGRTAYPVTRGTSGGTRNSPRWCRRCTSRWTRPVSSGVSPRGSVTCQRMDRWC